ncbi:MAG TPA: cytochrome c oxidase subunit 3, partial [Candidatus Binatia bacterium]|nr:cytochrome c oxidase subunit 3 [Candidatus Binatia bacterium]
MTPAHAAAMGHEWKGRVGMIGLIIAEGSLFGVFVVAHLFYAGKSLHGPLPREVLEIPVLGTVCLLSSSVTVALGARALARGRVDGAGLWLLVTALLGAIFLVGTAREWYQLIYRDSLTIGTNLFGTTFYPLVGLHASHVIAGLVMLALCSVFAATGTLRAAHAERVEM